MSIIDGYSDDQVKNWMQGKSQDEVAAQAASMGLTSDQVARAYGTTGQNYTSDDVNWWAGQHGYDFGGENGAGQRKAAASTAGARNDGMDPNAKNPLGLGPIGRNALVPTAGGNGKKLTVGEVRDFAATNPSTEEILKQAANYHMSLEELTSAISYAHGGYGDMSDLLKVNDMINKSKGAGYDASGWIVPTNGLGKQQKYDNTGEWIVGGNGDAFPGSHQYDQTADFINMPGTGTPGTGPNGYEPTRPPTTPGTGPNGYEPTRPPTGPLTTTTTAGTTTGNTPVNGTGQINWNRQATQFNTPVLNALYNAQQQRMTTQAPRFSFPNQGALTRVIAGDDGPDQPQAFAMGGGVSAMGGDSDYGGGFGGLSSYGGFGGGGMSSYGVSSGIDPTPAAYRPTRPPPVPIKPPVPTRPPPIPGTGPNAYEPTRPPPIPGLYQAAPPRPMAQQARPTPMPAPATTPAPNPYQNNPTAMRLQQMRSAPQTMFNGRPRFR